MVKVFLALLCLGYLASGFTTPSLFRIGTGGSSGTYFPIGSLIAASISDVFSGDAGQPNFASVDGLFAVAQRSNGSVANVEDIENGLLEGALSQADVTHWAYYGTGPYSTQPAKTSLRAVASLYPESLHLVVRSESNIRSVRDLIGHRVSIDEAGSGTLFDVRTVLEAYGIAVDEINAVYLKPADAIDRFRQDKLDAFFIVAGYPVSAISELVRENKAVVVPIDGVEIDILLRQYPFFSRDVIPSNAYPNASEVPTVAVTAQLLVSSDISEELAYEITRKLWDAETLEYLADGHPKGRAVQLDTALIGISIPLHNGARQFYSELGISMTGIPVYDPLK
ncbi:MAG: TAXI family TRAP transporter solute-binding subunit [Granulosicoccaceae bacterium]